MPEVIKTILTADSSEHRAEFGKAAAVVADYLAKQQAGFARALAGYKEEIGQLRLVAAGHKGAAAAIREEITIRDQAAALAARANITEQQALAIVRERLALSKQVAAAAIAEAAARQAATARTAAIANPRATGLPGGGGLAPLTPQSLKAMERAAMLQQNLNRQLYQTKAAGKAGGLGILAVSQGIEDAQYGIKGIINNIPQAIMGFGGSAGLAGAISLAVVGVYALYQGLKQLSGLTDLENWEKARLKGVDSYTKALKENLKAVADLRQGEQLTSREAIRYQEETENLEKLIAVDEKRFAQLQREATIRTEMRGTADKIRGERRIISKVGITDTRASGAADFDAAKEDYLLNQARVQEDLTAKEAEALAIAANYSKIVEANRAATNRFDQERLRALADQESARDKVARQDAERIQSEAQLAGEKSKYTAAERRAEVANLKSIEDRLAKNQQELRDADARLETLNRLRDESGAATRANLKELSDKATANRQEVEDLQRLRRANEELGKATADRIKAETAAALERQRIEEKREVIEKWRAQMDSEKSTGDARNRAADDLRVLALRASGQIRAANALAKEIRLRREAADIAKEQGLSEEDAYQQVLLRQKLLERINRNSRGGRRIGAVGGIGGRANVPGDNNSGNNMQEWQWRLGRGAGRLESRGSAGRHIENGQRGSILEKRAKERSLIAPRPDDSSKILSDIRDSNQQMVGIFKKLGVY